MDTFTNKMDMSLDDIILQEQNKKSILRTSSSNSLENLQDDMLQDSTVVSMNSTKFLPENSKFVPRRIPGLSQHQWLHYRNMNKYGRNSRRRNGHIQRMCPGIPLLKLKQGFRQGVLGNKNYNIKAWRKYNGSRFQDVRSYSGNTYPLTTNYLQLFDKQNCETIPKRGPGSVGSRGSLCSYCSKTSSVRSHTSYRSVRSNRSGRSNRSRSSYSNSRKSSVATTYRFSYYLNRKIQQHIQHMQENKALRVHNSSRETLIDEPAKCKPMPRHTWCSLHHRFKKYILNPLD